MIIMIVSYFLNRIAEMFTNWRYQRFDSFMQNSPAMLLIGTMVQSAFPNSISLIILISLYLLQKIGRKKLFQSSGFKCWKIMHYWQDWIWRYSCEYHIIKQRGNAKQNKHQLIYWNRVHVMGSRSSYHV